MQSFKCPKGCCTIKVSPYSPEKNLHEKVHKKRRKAGVFIYDSKLDKVLLVQSRGNLWGPPKGTLKYMETERKCAIREVREETGLEISDSCFTRAINIHNHAIYFYMEKEVCPVEIQNHIQGNDANGICWIKPACLQKCIKNGNISLSKHCRIVFQRFIQTSFPESEFILVKRKRKMSE